MLVDNVNNRANALLKQRNILVIASLGLLALNISMVIAVVSKDREIILQPMLTKPVTIRTGDVDPTYLEAVTRDTALTLLNRSPATLDYWMSEVLKLVDPTAQGPVKRELMKIVREQRNSDMVQAFAMSALRVSPKSLESQVEGVVSTYVGTKVISNQKRVFNFRWKYEGVSLRLVGFEMLGSGEDFDA